MRIKLCICLVISFCGGQAAADGNEVIAGRIASINRNLGNVQIERANTEPISPGNGAPLYNNDVVVIVGNAVVCIEEGFKDLDCSQGPLRIKIRSDASPHRPGVFGLLSAWLSRPGHAFASLPKARYDDDPPVGPLEPHALLPTNSSQFIPIGYAVLFPLWSNGSGVASWTAASERLPSYIGEPNGWRLPHAVTCGTLSAGRTKQVRELNWKVETRSEVPWGDAPSLPAAEITDTDRVDRAAWLLRAGPKEWRLFALSELYQLSRLGVFEAKALLDYARSPVCVTPANDKCPFVGRFE